MCASEVLIVTPRASWEQFGRGSLLAEVHYPDSGSCTYVKDPTWLVDRCSTELSLVDHTEDVMAQIQAILLRLVVWLQLLVRLSSGKRNVNHAIPISKHHLCTRESDDRSLPGIS